MKNENELISNLKHYYDLSLAVLKKFGGPSVYFHIQSINEVFGVRLKNNRCQVGIFIILVSLRLSSNLKGLYFDKSVINHTTTFL